MVLGGYNKIIEMQLVMGIIEKLPGKSTGKRAFYIPHKPVMRKGATSTKVRLVFDANSKPNQASYSINECMSPIPTMQPLLRDNITQS